MDQGLMMDLRALRYFVSVAQMGGITRAAQALNVAQPALSRQIRKLEGELGVPLLLRRPRGVELTPTGARLLERAEAVFQSLRETAEELRSDTLAGRGRISLGVPPTMGVMLVPELMQRFRATLPQAALHVREGVGHWLVEWVLEQRVDLALVHNPPRLPELEVEPLVAERMVLVLPPAGIATDWPVPSAGEISLAQALQLPLILPTHPHTNRLLLDSALARGMQPVRPAMEVDSVSITKAMIGAGLGATILTHAAVHADAVAGRLRAVPIGRPPLISSLALVRLRRHAADLVLERTRTLIRETLSRLAQQGILHGALATSHVLGSSNAKD
jgi:LysR family nitrogen assimilation transcriptional regulator